MSVPVAQRALDPSTIPDAIGWAMMIHRFQLDALDRLGIDPKGLSVLELGPGSDFGPALMLASMGAKVTLADRFLSRWQADFHPAFYRRLAETWGEPAGEVLAAAEGYEHTSLTLLDAPAEQLPAIADESIDFIFSHTVFEHIRDIPAVAAETSRVMRAGGKAAHIIDWRDHRNMSRPITHLLMSDQAFIAAADDALWEFGNRYRPSEFEAMFEAEGWSILGSEAIEATDKDYLAEVLPKLRRSPSSYCLWPEQDLGWSFGWLYLQKAMGKTRAVNVSRGTRHCAAFAAFKAAAKEVGERRFAQDLEGGHLLDIPVSAISTSPDGHMWNVPLQGLTRADCSDHPYRSELTLLEDGRPLGPAHSQHAVIRAAGGGRYSHWVHTDEVLFFSTSDNSSPLDNGRRYSVAFPKAG